MSKRRIPILDLMLVVSLDTYHRLCVADAVLYLEAQ